MTLLEKENSFFGRKNRKTDYKDLQFYIYLTDMDDSNYIQTLASLPLVLCCIKFKMDSQGSLHMPVKECQRQQGTSITELEMCRLAMNIAAFFHLLKKADFNAVVDCLAITHIMRSKAEPTTTRIKRSLELLSLYSLNLYYIKGKDMVLSDFLSRQKTDDSNPHKLIPISFMLRNQIDDHFYRINSKTDQSKTDKYLVQTRSQTKSSSIKIPEINGANKGLDPHVQPGKQRPLPSLPIHSTDKGPPTHPIPKPRMGQGRARLRRKVKTHQPISLPQQSPAQPMMKHVQKTVMPLPESTAQSQIDVLPQPISIPLPQPTPTGRSYKHHTTDRP